jgi:hypothetical protein
MRVCERGELNGKVFSADAAKPSAEAVAIRGDRIIAVGTSAEIETLAGAKTRRIDLQGAHRKGGLQKRELELSVTSVSLSNRTSK